MSEYVFNDNLLIEGFDPEKLKDLQQKSERNIGWETVYGAYQNDKILQAEVKAIERIGTTTCAVVMVENVRGIIPLEFFGAQNRRHLRTFMGKKVAFKVVNYDREAEIFTASRVEAQKHIAKLTLKRINVGDETPFIVTAVRRHGLFGDIGGVQAYIPIDQVRYGWIDSLYDEYKEGDHLLVKILEIKEKGQTVKEEDEDTQEAEGQEQENEVNKEESENEPIEYRVNVSRKALLENPWDANGTAHRFLRGNEYVGVVSGVVDFGVFVRLADGVDSLARHLKFENVNKGDEVTVRVQDVDVANEQIRSRIVRKI